jgi:hypothetical protein
VGEAAESWGRASPPLAGGEGGSGGQVGGGKRRGSEDAAQGHAPNGRVDKWAKGASAWSVAIMAGLGFKNRGREAGSNTPDGARGFARWRGLCQVGQLRPGEEGGADQTGEARVPSGLGVGGRGQSFVVVGFKVDSGVDERSKAVVAPHVRGMHEGRAIAAILGVEIGAGVGEQAKAAVMPERGGVHGGGFAVGVFGVDVGAGGDQDAKAFGSAIHGGVRGGAPSIGVQGVDVEASSGGERASESVDVAGERQRRGEQRDEQWEWINFVGVAFGGHGGVVQGEDLVLLGGVVVGFKSSEKMAGLKSSAPGKGPARGQELWAGCFAKGRGNENIFPGECLAAGRQSSLASWFA